jgi:hypothetical protein
MDSPVIAGEIDELVSEPDIDVQELVHFVA